MDSSSCAGAKLAPFHWGGGAEGGVEICPAKFFDALRIIIK